MKEVSALLLLHDFCNLDIHWKSKVFSNVLKDPWKIFENLESDAKRLCCDNVLLWWSN